MLFGRITTSTVVRNLTGVSSTTDKINRISNHFWDKWKYVYAVNLRETQRTSKLNINSPRINVNDFVLVYYEKAPRHFRRIAIVTGLLPSRDSEKAGSIVKIANTNSILKRPVNKLFSFENIYYNTNQTDKAREQKLRREAPVISELMWKYES